MDDSTHQHGSDKKIYKELSIKLQCGASLYGREVLREDQNRQASDVVVIVVHGGPGLSDHTESFAGLQRAIEHCSWENGGVAAVVFYDQLGCGRSDKPKVDKDGTDDRYSLHSYTQELLQVVSFVAQCHANVPICLLGHSWGGQIVLELLLSDSVSSRTTPMATLLCGIISNSPLNETSYQQKQESIRSGLDPEMRKFMEEDDASATSDGSVGALVYRKLIGASETNITGELKGWSVLDRLNRLAKPCLFLSGTHDTVPVEEYQEIGTNAKLTSQGHCAVILEGGEHGPFYGPTADAFFGALTNFMASIVRSSNAD